MQPQLEGFWGSVLSGVIANLIWFCITAFLAAAYWLRKDRSKFNGHWKAEIRWDPAWAKRMLVGDKGSDPHSDGELALAYGSGAQRNRYWGLSVWHLRDGTRTLAELCVELRGIELGKAWCYRPPFFCYRLQSARFSSRIRRTLCDFEYPAEFASYEIQFQSATEDRLEGQVQAWAADQAKMQVVGRFHAERLA